ANRIAQISYADAIDRQLPRVGMRLDIRDQRRFGAIHCSGSRGTRRVTTSPSLSHSRPDDRRLRNVNVLALAGRLAETGRDRCSDALGVKTAVRELRCGIALIDEGIRQSELQQ